MNTRKSTSAIFLTVGMIVILILTSCGSPAPAATEAPVSNEPVATEPVAVAEPVATDIPAASNEPVTLNILHNWGPSDSKGPILRKIFDDFMAANPNIKIVEDIKSDADIPTAVETAFMAEQEPDIVFSNITPNIRANWLSQKLTVPAGDYMADFGFEGKFVEAGISNYTYEGQLIGFPLEGFTWPFWYNTKIFEEVALPIPTTWDEVIAAAPKIKAAGYDVLAASSGSDPGFYVFFSMLASSMTKEEFAKWSMEGHLADYPNGVKAVEQFVKAREAGVFPKNAAGMAEAEVNNLFYTGKAAILPAGAWYYAECPEEMRPFVKLGGTLLTTPAASTKQHILSDYGAKGVFITRNGVKKLDAVKKFIQFLYTPDSIGQFVEKAGMLSPLKVANYDDTKMNSLIVQSLTLYETVELYSYPPSAPGVDPSQTFKDIWLATTTAEAIVKGYDQAYLDGLGK